jgi:hypothetical protein
MLQWVSIHEGKLAAKASLLPCTNGRYLITYRMVTTADRPPTNADAPSSQPLPSGLGASQLHLRRTFLPNGFEIEKAHADVQMESISLDISAARRHHLLRRPKWAHREPTSFYWHEQSAMELLHYALNRDANILKRIANSRSLTCSTQPPPK